MNRAILNFISQNCSSILSLLPSFIAVTNLYAKFWTLRKKFSVNHFVMLCRIQNRLHDKLIKHTNVVIRIKDPKMMFVRNVIDRLSFYAIKFCLCLCNIFIQNLYIFTHIFAIFWTNAKHNGKNNNMKGKYCTCDPKSWVKQ